MSLRKGVLKIRTKFVGDHPCRRAISIKLLCNLIEIPLRHGCSPVNLLHTFSIPFIRTPLDGYFCSFKTEIRSSGLEVFCKIGVLKNFAKFAGKHQNRNLVFVKVSDLRPAISLKKRPGNVLLSRKFKKFI